MGRFFFRYPIKSTRIEKYPSRLLAIKILPFRSEWKHGESDSSSSAIILRKEGERIGKKVKLICSPWFGEQTRDTRIMRRR